MSFAVGAAYETSRGINSERGICARCLVRDDRGRTGTWLVDRKSHFAAEIIVFIGNHELFIGLGIFSTEP
jgi:hypothetical protein